RVATSTPSTLITAVSVSTQLPSSSTDSPSTLTRPAAISYSDPRREATPARPNTFCSRTPTCSGDIDLIHVRRHLRKGRQLRQRGDSQTFQKHSSGDVQCASGLLVGACSLEEAASEQGPYHTVDVHTADRGHSGPSNRLTVGNHCQCLQSRPRQLGTLTLQHQFLDERRVDIAGEQPPTVLLTP